MPQAELQHAEPRPRPGLGARLVRSLSAQMSTQLLRIVQQILLVPFFLRAWGVELYNDWLLINAATALLTVFDGGMQPYFSGLLQETKVRGEAEAYRRAVKMANFNYLAVIALALAVIALTSLWLKWLPLIGIDHMGFRQSYWTLGLLAGNTLLAMPFGVVNSVYRANGEYDRGVIMGAGNLAGQILIPLALLTFGQPSTALAAGMVGGTAASWIVILIDQRLRYGQLPSGLAVPSRDELRITVSKCLYFATQPISTWMTIQGPLLVLGHLSDPAETVAFNTARTLIGVGRQITIQMSFSFGFELSILLLREELESLRRLLVQSITIVGIAGGLLAGVTVVAAEPVVLLWLRGKVEIPQLLILTMAIPAAVSASSQIYQVVLSFCNRPRLIAHGVGIFAAIGFTGALALVRPLGAEGVAIGLAVGEIVGMVMYLPTRTLSSTGMREGHFHAASILRAVLAALLGYAAGRLAILVVAPTDYPRLFLFAALWAMIAGVGAYALLLNGGQRGLIARRFAFLRPRQPALTRKS